MEIIVLDSFNKEINRYNGFLEGGIFKYKVGGVLGIGSKTKTLPVLADTIIQLRKERVAYLRFDGKDFTPIFINEIPNDIKQKYNNSINDILTEAELSQLHETAMLNNPLKSLKNILDILLVIGVAILLIYDYTVASQLKETAKTLVAPLNTSIHQNTLLISLLINTTNKLSHYECNLTTVKKSASNTSATGVI